MRSQPVFSVKPEPFHLLEPVRSLPVQTQSIFSFEHFGKFTILYSRVGMHPYGLAVYAFVSAIIWAFMTEITRRKTIGRNPPVHRR